MRSTHSSWVLNTRALLAVAGLSVGVLRGQDGPAPIKSFGGAFLAKDRIEILDVDARKPRILVMDRTSLLVTREILLKPPVRAIEPFGLVRSPKGEVLVLGDRGLRLVRYESESSTPSEERLPELCTGVASLKGRTILTPARSAGGDYLVAEWEDGALRRFGTLSSREARTKQIGIITNLFACGAGQVGELPCWHPAGGTDIYLLSDMGRIRRVRVPSDATRASAPSKSNPSDPFSQFSYPMRDVFQVSGSLFWILTNQEGSIPPSDDRAVRSRHAVLVDERGVVLGTVQLPKEGRAILEGSDKDVTIYFKDATVARYAR